MQNVNNYARQQAPQQMVGLKQQQSKAVVAQQMKQQLYADQPNTKSKAMIGGDLKPYPLTQDFRMRGTSSNQR